MLSKPGEKAHFAKIMVIRWVFVKILSRRDAVPSADFTTVYCKKSPLKSFLPLSLLDQHLKFVLKSRKLHFYPSLGHFWIQNSEENAHFSCKFGVLFQE